MTGATVKDAYLVSMYFAVATATSTGYIEVY